jgi:hypothetical protein
MRSTSSSLPTWRSRTSGRGVGAHPGSGSAHPGALHAAPKLGVLASLPPAFVVALIALNVIHPTLGLGLGLAAALLLGDGFGWQITAVTFDRERLVTGTRP